MRQCHALRIYSREINLCLLLWHQQWSTIGNSYQKYSPTLSTYGILRIAVSPKSRKICINKTIQHPYIRYIEHYTFVFGTLDIPRYPLHRSLMWWLGFMGKPFILINIKVNIWPCVLFQIKHHIYAICILMGPVYLGLGTILICPKWYINLGWSLQPNMNLHHSVFQGFLNQYSSLKLESTIVQCLGFNA